MNQAAVDLLQLVAEQLAVKDPETYRGVVPFLVSDAVRVALLLAFPVLALGFVRLIS